MNIKKFFGLLMICAVAIFAFTACSSDDDDEKVGTFEYAIGCPSFEGDFVEGMQKINDAFNQVFGVTDKTFKLTGTHSECNRKAKEYAMKAQAALVNGGSLGATVNLVNVTTDELIHSFTIKMDENIGHIMDRFKYVLGDKSITFYNMKGNRIKIEYNYRNTVRIGFDEILDTKDKTIDLMSVSKPYEYTSVGWYKVTFCAVGKSSILIRDNKVIGVEY